ncbi:LuxR family transcriptional regulator [Kitasatospora sp. NPDC088346]|uniref:response regulator transcription factor n=1 Tax=Kitasatospora sp. NPDC088346 TaxID=3364073 RepID=UPI0038187B65
MQRITVSIHSDDPLSRAGVAAQLRHRPEIHLIGPDPEGSAEAGEPQVAVLIADLSDESTIVTLRRLRRGAGMRVVLVTTDVREIDLMKLVEDGVAAVLRRAQVGEASLVGAILAAARGDGHLPPDLLGRLLSQIGRMQRSSVDGRPAPLVGLSDREREVLRMIGDGMDSAEIATKLAYSERTIKNILHSVMTRMNLRNRAHAVAHAMREGYL